MNEHEPDARSRAGGARPGAARRPRIGAATPRRCRPTWPPGSTRPSPGSWPSGEPRTPANVVPLRRRWAPRAAAAAAAVIVLGAGGVAAANLGVFNGTANDTASSADSSAGGGSSSTESLDGAATTAPPSNPAPVPNALPVRLPRVTAASFDADVARLLQQRSRGPGQRRQPAQVRAGQPRPARRAAACPGPSSQRRLHDHPGAVRRHPGRARRPPRAGGRAPRRGVDLRRQPRARQRQVPASPMRPASPAAATPD